MMLHKRPNGFDRASLRAGLPSEARGWLTALLSLPQDLPESSPANRVVFEMGDAMRLHKFFAYATVMCFLLTMYTGYNRN